MSTELMKEINGYDLNKLIAEGSEGLRKAGQAVQQLPEKITSNEQFEQAKALQNKIKASASFREEKRKPFTRKLDEIKKAFTEIENGLMALSANIQTKLDAYALVIATEERKKEQERQRALMDERQKIEDERRKQGVRDANLNSMLDLVRNYAADIIKSITKANMKEAEKKLSVVPEWKEKQRLQFLANDAEATAEQIKEASEVFLEQSKKILKEAIEIIPLVLQNKAEAEKLLKEQEALAKEEAEKASKEADAKAEAEKALAQLDSTPLLVTNNGPKTKSVVEIVVKDSSGWLQIIAFWFEKDEDAKKKDLSKKTFMQCLKFVEKWANTHGERIESEAILYKEVTKAR